MHHRNYNPKTGVFTSADPAKDDLNLYRYVKNNPVNRTDPSGLDNIEVSDTTRVESSGIFGGYEKIPRDGSRVIWNVTAKADRPGPQIAYRVESFHIGKYESETQSVRLLEKFGGGLIRLQSLQEFAANRSLLADASGESREVPVDNPLYRIPSDIFDYFTKAAPAEDISTEDTVASALKDAVGSEAFADAVDQEYRRLLEAKPEGWGSWILEKIGEELYGVSNNYEESLLAKAELNVLREIKDNFLTVAVDRMIGHETEHPHDQKSAISVGLSQADAVAGIDLGVINARIREIESSKNVKLAGINETKARAALKFFGVKTVRSGLLKLAQKIGKKGLAKYFDLRRLGTTAREAFATITTQLHHAIPKFLGGLDQDQDLLGIPAKLHAAYHRMLNEALRSRGLDELIGPRSRINIRTLQGDPVKLRGAYDAIIESANRFDRAYPGYDVTKKFWDNYFKGQFKIAPGLD